MLSMNQDNSQNNKSTVAQNATQESLNSKKQFFAGDRQAFEQSRAYMRQTRNAMGAQAYAAMAQKAYQTNMPSQNQGNLGATFDAYDDQDVSLQKVRPHVSAAYQASMGASRVFNTSRVSPDPNLDAYSNLDSQSDFDSSFNPKLAGNHGTIQDAQIYTEEQESNFEQHNFANESLQGTNHAINEHKKIEDISNSSSQSSLQDTSTKDNEHALHESLASNNEQAYSNNQESLSSSQELPKDSPLPSTQEWSDFMSRLSQYPSDHKVSSLKQVKDDTKAPKLEPKAEQNTSYGSSYDDTQNSNTDSRGEGAEQTKSMGPNKGMSKDKSEAQDKGISEADSLSQDKGMPQNQNDSQDELRADSLLNRAYNQAERPAYEHNKEQRQAMREGSKGGQEQAHDFGQAQGHGASFNQGLEQGQRQDFSQDAVEQERNDNQQIPSEQQWSDFMERLAQHNDALRSEQPQTPAQGMGRIQGLSQNQAKAMLDGASGGQTQYQGASEHNYRAPYQGDTNTQGQSGSPSFHSGKAAPNYQYMGQAQHMASSQSQDRAYAMGGARPMGGAQGASHNYQQDTSFDQSRMAHNQAMYGQQSNASAINQNQAYTRGQAQSQYQGQDQARGQEFHNQGFSYEQGNSQAQRSDFGNYDAGAQANNQGSAFSSDMNHNGVDGNYMNQEYLKARPMAQEKLSQNLAFHIFMVAVISISLLIPSLFFEYVLDDRLYTEETAIKSIIEPWGEAQTLADPVLVMDSYVRSSKHKIENENIEVIYNNSFVFAYANESNSNNIMELEKRSRGNYVATLYKAHIEQKGVFDLKSIFEQISLNNNIELESDCRLFFPVYNRSSIGEITFVNINGKDFKVEPSDISYGFMVKISNDDLEKILNGILLGNSSNQDSKVPALYNSLNAEKAKENEDNNSIAIVGKKEQEQYSLVRPGELSYHAKYEVRGSQSFSYIALGNNTFTSIEGSGTVPSFSGNFLPTEHNIDEETLTFNASYKQSNLATGVNQIEINDSFSFNRSLYKITIADRSLSYTLIERLTKYVLLFIAMTFVTVLAFEIVAKRMVSLVQYVVIGVALVLFYMVLLSLNEHINFTISYIAAALLMSTMIALYLKAVLDSKRNAICVFLLLLAMYAVLFAIVHIQAYALLVGTVLLVCMLGVVMFITRKLNASIK